jgi:hypothetical protein
VKTPGRTPLGQVRLNAAQFEVIGFADFYGRACQLEQDSLADFTPAGSSALWLGRLDPGGNSRQDTLMLLKLDQVKALIATLEMWVDRCSFDENWKPGSREKLT